LKCNAGKVKCDIKEENSDHVCISCSIFACHWITEAFFSKGLHYLLMFVSPGTIYSCLYPLELFTHVCISCSVFACNWITEAFSMSFCSNVSTSILQ
jgi:hypothetical protein